ncbi:MAG TPA: ABC transporter ATP-binding protein [Tepidisphaeraceae bacterium]|jgi:NitT/TauT family transport system ATP-binding protein
MSQFSGRIAIALDNVAMTFPRGTQALRPVSLQIAAGQFLCLLGPSGCGKSTLLRIIAGLQMPSAGEVIRDDGAGSVSFVFQDAHLLPWRNISRNVTLPLELAGIEKSTRRARASEMLEQVGLADFQRHYPAQLSGGMKMRASLARALVSNPSLLLLDEPFAAVDEMTRQKLDEQLLELWRKRGMTVIFVTHSVAEAAFLGQRAVVFSPRPGRVLLDHVLDLPAQRNLALRSDPQFARECGVLYQALEQGGRA